MGYGSRLRLIGLGMAVATASSDENPLTVVPQMESAPPTTTASHKSNSSIAWPLAKTLALEEQAVVIV